MNKPYDTLEIKTFLRFLKKHNNPIDTNIMEVLFSADNLNIDMLYRRYVSVIIHNKHIYKSQIYKDIVDMENYYSVDLEWLSYIQEHRGSMASLCHYYKINGKMGRVHLYMTHRETQDLIQDHKNRILKLKLDRMFDLNYQFNKMIQYFTKIYETAKAKFK